MISNFLIGLAYVFYGIESVSAHSWPSPSPTCVFTVPGKTPNPLIVIIARNYIKKSNGDLVGLSIAGKFSPFRVL